MAMRCRLMGESFTDSFSNAAEQSLREELALSEQRVEAYFRELKAATDQLKKEKEASSRAKHSFGVLKKQMQDKVGDPPFRMK